MKIEIEFEEVEAIRKRLEYQEQENERLCKKLDALDEKVLKKQAVDLSMKLLDEYVLRIFKGLGFESGYMNRAVNFEGVDEHLGSPWWKRDDLDITIGVSIHKEFRSAFLNIGVVPQEVTELNK